MESPQVLVGTLLEAASPHALTSGCHILLYHWKMGITEKQRNVES